MLVASFPFGVSEDLDQICFREPGRREGSLSDAPPESRDRCSIPLPQLEKERQVRVPRHTFGILYMWDGRPALKRLPPSSIDLTPKKCLQT